MPAGPCTLCGTRDYALSLGGPTLCPSCDCGNFHDPALARKRMLGLAPPPTHDERKAKMVTLLAADAGLIQMRALHAIDRGQLMTLDDVEPI